MNINREDILLEDLIELEWMTVRSLNICKDAGLISLNRILDFYLMKGSFLTIRNCGTKTEIELIEICKKYLASNPVNIEVIEYEQGFIEIINTFTPYQKATLNRHFEYLVSNLNIRSYNGLKSIQESLIPKDIFEEIFSVSFNFKKLNKIGNKSVNELEKFKNELIRFVYVLQNIPKDQLSKEFTKVILKTTFDNLPKNFEEQFEKVFDENGNIKIFTLIKYLINSGQLFSAVQRNIFELSYTNCSSSNIDNDSIAKEHKITRERVRQIKIKLEEEIQSYFMFVSNLITDDLINYKFNPSNVFLTIDKSFSNKINITENVNFNSTFYSIIFGIFLNKTHSILGDNEIIFGKRKTANHKKYENCYLIDSLLFECFDFENFVSDIYLKVNEKISETYSLHFQGYLYDFLKNEGKVYFNEVYSVCETIIFSEFELLVDSDGYLNFERTTRKQVHEYCFDVLEAASEPMTLDQIVKSVSEIFPDFNTTIDSLRGSLNREKELFINFSRTSTYGLRKWEIEKENLKGGTIRDIVEEFLLNEISPKHISQIAEYVMQFRPETNEKSVLNNIKVDERKRFKFFRKAFVGLCNKKYNESNFKEIDYSNSWLENFYELKKFKDEENKWPSLYSSNKFEKALYAFGYRARKTFQKGRLNEENVILLKSIGFPIEEIKFKNNNWHQECIKLKYFINLENRMPSSNSTSKEERSLYRFIYLNKKAFQKNKLTNEQIEILTKMNFNFNIL